MSINNIAVSLKIQHQTTWFKTAYKAVSHTPKRGVGGSNPLWDARKPLQAFFRGLQRFLFLLLPVISTFVTGKFLCADTRAAIQETRNEYSCRRELAAGAFVV
jgi:hypothetical protein